jgi:hypothetical protein
MFKILYYQAFGGVSDAVSYVKPAAFWFHQLVGVE